jgi:hypothetical protein
VALLQGSARAMTAHIGNEEKLAYLAMQGWLRFQRLPLNNHRTRAACSLPFAVGQHQPLPKTQIRGYVDADAQLQRAPWQTEPRHGGAGRVPVAEEGAGKSSG